MNEPPESRELRRKRQGLPKDFTIPEIVEIIQSWKSTRDLMESPLACADFQRLSEHVEQLEDYYGRVGDACEELGAVLPSDWASSDNELVYEACAKIKQLEAENTRLKAVAVAAAAVVEDGHKLFEVEYGYCITRARIMSALEAALADPQQAKGDGDESPNTE